jgi:hypothetical protein
VVWILDAVVRWHIFAAMYMCCSDPRLCGLALGAQFERLGDQHAPPFERIGAQLEPRGGWRRFCCHKAQG